MLQSQGLVDKGKSGGRTFQELSDIGPHLEPTEQTDYKFPQGGTYNKTEIRKSNVYE
jgi:hypothetical protein